MKNKQALLFENGMGYVAVRTIAFGGHSWFIAIMKWQGVYRNTGIINGRSAWVDVYNTKEQKSKPEK